MKIASILMSEAGLFLPSQGPKPGAAPCRPERRSGIREMVRLFTPLSPLDKFDTLFRSDNLNYDNIHEIGALLHPAWIREVNRTIVIVCTSREKRVSLDPANF